MKIIGRKHIYKTRTRKISRPLFKKSCVQTELQLIEINLKFFTTECRL